MLQMLLGPALELGKEFIKGKADEKKAIQERKINAIQNDANWEDKMAEASKNSWKDEWLTIVFSIPLILVFIPSMVGHIQAGFNALATLPIWYHEILMVIVLASFGVKAGKGLMETLRK
jgi:hypothetical protein